LNGDFSVLDGAKASGGCLAKAVTLKDRRASLSRQRDPDGSFDHSAVTLLNNYIPTSTDPCGLLLYAIPQNNPDNQWIGRIDYSLSDNNTMFGRYYLYDYTAQTLFDGKNALTTTQAGNNDRSMTATYGDTWTLGPTR